MKIGIFGTGGVGRIFAAKLIELGHDVILGTRDVAKTLVRTDSDAMGNPAFTVWHEQHPTVKLGNFAEAAAYGDLLFNCTAGTASLAVLQSVGEVNLNGKILIDIANPLDFSKGMPPSLSVSNTDSLAEQIQRNYPQLKVVKTLNTMNAHLMVNPALLNEAHDVFLSGNDSEAKSTVVDILKNWFGWKEVIDLGDISTARGTEMLLPIWLELWAALQTPMFNFKIVR